MATIPDQPCAHPACGCKVEQTGQFCSDFCRNQGGSIRTESCECGHSDCVIEEALQHTDPAR